MSKRARIKWAGQCETWSRVDRVRSLCARRAAVLIIVNSMVGHPLEAFPVSLPLNTISWCIIILQTGGGVLTFRRIVSPNFVGALPPPPPNKIVLPTLG